MYMVYGTLEPILSLRLQDYDLSQQIIGLIFGVEPLTYMLGTFLVPCILPKWVEHRVTLITSLFLLGISTALVGPPFGDTSMASMITGLALSGFLMGFLCIPNMPEMMQATRQAYPDSDLNHANSLLSGILNAGFGIGQAAGPLLGAFLY